MNILSVKTNISLSFLDYRLCEYNEQLARIVVPTGVPNDTR